MADGRDVRFLLDIRDAPLSAEECLKFVADPSAGGVDLFLGVVRDDDGGHSVEKLAYSAHPSALEQLRQIAQEVVTGVPVVAVAAIHRVGELAIGDVAVVVAVSAVHRGEAFDACRLLIDRLKHEVPIWKHQTFTDGRAEWVAAC
ncbi:MAG TPA: molybdenum cofactor biosynthesis protein MoaE [Frankiaceae bacterium]|nr:molybdenum cofactor biosynthesis protein MoaE [Frankiaceae bacterium]